MPKEKIMIAIILAFMFAVFISAGDYAPPRTIPDSSDLAYKKESVRFDGYICADVKRANGDYSNLGCRHNLLTNVGREMIRNDLVDASAAWPKQNATYLSVGNGSAVAAGTNALDNERLDCGFNRNAGTVIYNNISSITVQRTFTYTCGPAQLINISGLSNATDSVSNVSLLFGGAIPNAPTLNTNDQLTINYTLAIT